MMSSSFLAFLWLFSPEGVYLSNLPASKPAVAPASKPTVATAPASKPAVATAPASKPAAATAPASKPAAFGTFERRLCFPRIEPDGRGFLYKEGRLQIVPWQGVAVGTSGEGKAGQEGEKAAVCFPLAFLKGEVWKTIRPLEGVAEPFFATEEASVVTGSILWEFELVKKRLDLLLDVMKRLPKPPASGVRWRAWSLLAQLHQQIGQMYGLVGAIARDSNPPLAERVREALFAEIREKQVRAWWKAFAAWVAGLQEFPTHPQVCEALFSQGEILLFLSYQADARQILEVILSDRRPCAIRGRAAASLAEIYVTERRTQAAIGVFSEALKSAELGIRPFLFYRQALAWMSLGDLVQAEKGLEQAIQAAARAEEGADLIGKARLKDLRVKIAQAWVAPLLALQTGKAILRRLERLPEAKVRRDILIALGERLILQRSWERYVAVFRQALEAESDPWLRLRWRLETLQGIVALWKDKKQDFDIPKVGAWLEKAGIEFEALRLRSPRDPRRTSLAFLFQSILGAFSLHPDLGLRTSAGGLLRWLENVQKKP